MYCPHCGNQLGGQVTFCPYCGQRVTAEPEPDASAQPTSAYPKATAQYPAQVAYQQQAGQGAGQGPADVTQQQPEVAAAPQGQGAKKGPSVVNVVLATVAIVAVLALVLVVTGVVDVGGSAATEDQTTETADEATDDADEADASADTGSADATADGADDATSATDATTDADDSASTGLGVGSATGLTSAEEVMSTLTDAYELLFTEYGSDDYESVVYDFVVTYLGLMPDGVLSAIAPYLDCESADDFYDYYFEIFYDYLDGSLDEYLDYLDGLGIDLYMEIDEELDADDLGDLEDEFSYYCGTDCDVQSGYETEIFMTLQYGSETDTESLGDDFLVLCIDGSWYLWVD